MNTSVMDQFPRGVSVQVNRRDDDQFNYDFAGIVIAYSGGNVIVEDQDGDCWDCEPEQLVITDTEI